MLKAGDIAPETGFYVALHSTPHVWVQRSMYLEGSRLEKCSLCPLGVWYRLDETSLPAWVAAPRTEIWDFVSLI